ncbi:fatty acid cis/trans isomerase [Alteromonas sp. A079]|uniref:fatty acid cis/trans isomerase n=1 Tax=Alteromonas sp. A079 TaxID=3410268 RepID=UPI003BA23520
MNRWFSSILILLALGLSAGIYHFFYSDTKAQPLPIVVPLANERIDYHQQVKPVVEQRCVVCHACFDAPCQLKMGSYTGIERGANKERVYDGERLVEANLTRLFEDAHTLEQWRAKDFFPVISDAPKPTTESFSSPTYQSSATDNLTTSVLAHLLQLKQDNPLVKDEASPSRFDEKQYPLNINREYQCPTIDDIETHKKDYPLWGMPYALPALSDEQHSLLMNWIAQGGEGNDDVTITANNQQQIEKWESFLNNDSLKSQLMSRYLFEHLFLVHLHFTAQTPQQFFKVIRSSTAPGQKVKSIHTRRPFDNPNVERVYYRIVPVKQTLVHKSHMPMLLTDNRMAKWKKWFLHDGYQVTALPSYLPEEASNPFVTFAQIPINARYNYMLDEAQNTIMQFIKGPVCRGQMALNVINDHFWVVFSEPDLDLVQNNGEFIQQALQNIALPAEEESTALPTAWMSYAAMEREYLNAKSKFIETQIQNKLSIDLNLLWDGDNDNPNMALTIFRHNDAASVVKGLVGETPQTAWVLTYPLFERIHYLLVAGYDVYGNVGHQLNSRMYMDFLRMEGEFNFLSLLPSKTKEEIRNKWYRGSVSEVEEFVYKGNTSRLKTNIEYETDTPYQELLDNIKHKFQRAISQRHSLENGFDNASLLDNFAEINKQKGKHVSLLPESTIVRIFDKSTGKQHFYTMLRHSAHTNISHLFNEDDRRLPEEDTVTIASGFMTSHPNAFLQVEISDVEGFAQTISAMTVEADYAALLDVYGVRRTNPQFWAFADNMHEYFKTHYPIEFGYLDFNRLENR